MTAKSIFLTSIFWFRVLDNDIITLMVTPSPLSTFKSQTGFVQYLLILILLIGIGIAVYLIQFTQVFKPKASENTSAAIKFTDQPIKSTVILNFKYNDEILNGQELRHWEESETLKYHKERILKARNLGFNTVWIIFPWQERDTTSSLLNIKSTNNLKQVVQYARDLKMNVILPVTYCFGFCWGVPQGVTRDAFQLGVNDPLWYANVNYLKTLVSELREFDNLHYLVFSENIVPERSNLNNPNNQELSNIYKTAFINYLKTKNPDIRFWNLRWSTNYQNFDSINMPSYIDPFTQGNIFFNDIWRWSASLVRSRITDLPAQLKPLMNPNSQIGYHDYLWDKDTVDELPLPVANSYDFLSIANYPGLSNTPINLESGRLLNLYNQYKSKYPNQPIFFGEVGVGVGGAYNEEQQNFLLVDLLNVLKGKVFGFNIWQLDDMELQGEPGGILRVDGTSRPVVQSLYNNQLLQIPAPLNNPKGYFDTANCEVISGWVCDSDDYSKSLDVIFWKDGVPGSGQHLATAKADQLYGSSQALASACGGNPRHGFILSTPDILKDGQPHDIRAYVVNFPEGDTAQIQNHTALESGSPVIDFSPKKLTCQPVPSSSPNSSPSSIRKIGDINNDGKIDIFDFNILIGDFRVVNLRSDLNNDGKVNIFDFNILLTNFGR
jgi:hypothetical protein